LPLGSNIPTRPSYRPPPATLPTLTLSSSEPADGLWENPKEN